MYKTYDEAIGQLTNQVNKRIMRYLNSKLESYDITLEQWNVLLKLSQENEINQKQLAQKVDKDQPTLARILDILERKNLIERRANESDKRAFKLNITDDGINLKNEVIPYIEQYFKNIISGISEGELEIFKKVMIKISSNIDNSEKREKID